MRDGDMWVANDPYITGTHLNDVTVVRPDFLRGALVGYAANKAHHADVGGSAPGSMPVDAADLFAEGLVVPPMRLVENDAPVAAKRRVVSRQLAHAARRAAAICARRSPATTPANAGCSNSASVTARSCSRVPIERMLDDSETRMRNALRRARRRTFRSRGFSRGSPAARRRCASRSPLTLRDGTRVASTTPERAGRSRLRSTPSSASRCRASTTRCAP